MKKYTLENLYSDLNIDAEEYKEFRDNYKNDFEIVIEKLNKNENLKPVFQSDLQREIDYLHECNKCLFIDCNINGIILYNTVEKNFFNEIMEFIIIKDEEYSVPYFGIVGGKLLELFRDYNIDFDFKKGASK